LFTSGYHANIGTITALCGPDDQIFSDALNHASIIDGCRLARARISVYPHCDTAALGQLLEDAPAARRRLIVTDSVFSMDGDLAPLDALSRLAREHGAWLMIDEAHAVGVFGPTGAGLAEALQVQDAVDVTMGTLGKALGGAGAYVAGAAALVDLLVNKARSFIYTTAPPPTTVATASAALDIVAAEPDRRRNLWARSVQLREGLADLGFRVGGTSHIVPLMVGDNAASVRLADAVQQRGVFARAIRPPTVPEGTARLRLTPMATHSEEQIERTLAAFADAGRSCGLLPGTPRAGTPESSSQPTTASGVTLPTPQTPQTWPVSPNAHRNDFAELSAWDHRYLWHPFTQMTEWLAGDPLIIERAEGNYLIDTDGRRYLDGVSSLWCNVHGHRHPVLDAAMREQLGLVAHSTLLGLTSPSPIRLARALIDHAPPGLTRVFYSDSGATAVEVALRMALQYCQLQGQTRRTELASLVGAYHGDTLGAVGVGYSETFHRFVRTAVHQSLRLTPPHVFRWERGLDAADALRCAIDEAQREIVAHADQMAALIVEPLMQGAAGMWAHPIEYLIALRDLTERHGILLICDEVATGFGRTGRLFACEHAGITPDILCLGKGITGGYLPLAATIATEEIFAAFLGRYEDFTAFFHGHTYTGNALACAVGVASLELFDQNHILDQLPPLIATLTRRLDAARASHPHIGDVRQWGLMAGIELVRDPVTREPYPAAARVGARVAREVRTDGVILRPLGDVIIILPPLSISAAEIDTIVDATLTAIRTVTASLPGTD
jgi:adenosylmethionine-8-amino-7-oxononanoate aminotransferase